MLRHSILVGLIATLTAGPILAGPKASSNEKPAVTTAVRSAIRTAVQLAVQAQSALKAAPAPADKPAAGDRTEPAALTVTVESVSGIAEKRSAAAEGGKWESLRAGDVLGELSLIRTGLGARVVLKFADRGDVTVKSGTKIGIASFRKTGKLVKTRLGLKYGAIRARVDSTRGANDFRIRTAVGTLAATGTSGNLAQWGDFSVQFKGTTGSWRANIADKITSVAAGEWTDRKASPSISIVLDRLDTKIGDLHGGLTKAEVRNLRLHSRSRTVSEFIRRFSKTVRLRRTAGMSRHRILNRLPLGAALPTK